MQLAMRELALRYRGSILGLVWLALMPVLLLSVYTFVFSTVFKARWSAADTGVGEFAVFLFAGLIVFNIVSETVMRAPSLMAENVTFIKKVVFPLEILPLVTLIVALVGAAVSYGILLVFYVAFFGLPPWTIIALPVLLAPLCLLTLGFSWLLAALGVYLRDMRQFVPPILTTLMFLSPVFYPLSAVPEDVRFLVKLSPLTPILEQTRAVIFDGQLPDLTALVLSLALGSVVAAVGLQVFQVTRRGFADVV